jgi:hypothetical protein
VPTVKQAMNISVKTVTKTAFIDVLFLTALTFVSLFILTAILINPPTKKQDVKKKADYIIVLDWDANVADDVDMWVQTPAGQPVGFKNTQNGSLYLERDDLGVHNDKSVDGAGNEVIARINREVITVRVPTAGEYVVNVHMYTKRGPEPVTGTVELIQINPYKVHRIAGFILQRNREELHMFRFTLKPNGKARDVGPRSAFFINKMLQASMHPGEVGYRPNGVGR